MLHLVETGRSGQDEAVTGADDSSRLAAVRRYEILDTAPEDAFDRITALAAELFDVPVAFIGIADSDRVWLKSQHGLDVGQFSRASEPYASKILSREPWMFAQSSDKSPNVIPSVGDLATGFYVGVPLRSDDGQILGTLCVVSREHRQIDEQKIRHLGNIASLVMHLLELRLLARQAAARTIGLAGEVDHRVMNSLQFVSSMLSMQSRAVHTPEAAEQLRAAASRVAAVARVHRYLSIDATVDRVPVLVYLRRLCSELSNILGVTVEVDGIEATISTSRVLALGLVVNELVTNAKKHGGTNIAVTLASESGSEFELGVIDDGPGLPEGFSLNALGAGLGMRVVAALVSQLDGRFSAAGAKTGKGTCFTVTFPHRIEER
jgi:two-component sensor histidine kinase